MSEYIKGADSKFWEHMGDTDNPHETEHNNTLNIQGGAVGDRQHITTAEKAQIGVIPNHNDTGSIQGGAVGNRFHLTEAQRDTVTAHPSTTNNPHGVTAAQVGAVASVVAGLNIEVDATDPQNPVVSTPNSVVFTNTTIIQKARANYETFTHNLEQQFILTQVMFKPTEGNFLNQWVNAEDMFFIIFQDSNNIRVYNKTFSSDIPVGDFKIVLRK